MKKIIFYTILISFIPTLVFAQVKKSGIRPYWVQSPQDLTLWLRGNFIYQKEKEEYWKQPYETVSDMGGDCEDFAFLVKHIFDDLFVKSTVIGVFFDEDKSGHAIAIFRERDGTLSYFSNREYIKMNKNSIREILDIMYPKWERYEYLHQSGYSLKKVYRN